MSARLAAATISTKAPPSKQMLADGGGVLLLGLPRSGTYSMATAMRILGHEHVFHDLDIANESDETSNAVWAGWFRAGWACMPYIRTHMGLPWFARPGWWNAGWRHGSAGPPPTTFTRADWDALLGHSYQVAADTPMLFAAELIAAYPDAQVILWERDEEQWLASFDQGVLQAFGFHSPLAMFVRRWIAPWSGMVWPTTQWYGHAGWLRAADYEGMRKNVRQRGREHLAMVRRSVKEGKLLEYRLGQGWEPLCEFLGCALPEEPFPHVNERDAFKKEAAHMLGHIYYLALWNLLKYPVLLGLGVLVAMLWGDGIIMR